MIVQVRVLYQQEENLFIDYLINNLELPNSLVRKIIEKARQHYFDPSDTVIEQYSVDQVYDLTEKDISQEEALKALEKLYGYPFEDYDRQEVIINFLEKRIF